MAQQRPHYEVNDEWNDMAAKLVAKYPEKFNEIEVGKICCVNVTNKTRKEKEGHAERIWRVDAVKMPMAIHCPYGWYLTLFSDDWDNLEEKHKLALVADMLHSIPSGEDHDGRVNPCDTKGYHSVFNTLGIDYLIDPDIPHLLDDEVEWKY